MIKQKTSATHTNDRHIDQCDRCSHMTNLFTYSTHVNLCLR